MSGHRIKKQRIVISPSGNASTQDIIKEIHILQEETNEMLNALFDKYIGEDLVVDLHKININLGTLPETNFKALYQSRLASLVEEELEKLTSSAELEMRSTASATQPVNMYRSLAKYLLTGYNASLQRDKTFDLNSLFEELLKDKAKMKGVLKEVWKSEAARKRIHHQLRRPIAQSIEALRGEATGSPEQKLSGSRIIDLLERYFIKGLWPDWYKKRAVYKLETLFIQLTRQEKKTLAAKLLPMLEDKAVRSRLAWALSLQSLKMIFTEQTALRKTLTELEVIEKALNYEVDLSFFYSSSAIEWKINWLAYLQAHQNMEEKARALLSIVQMQEVRSSSHAVSEITYIDRLDSDQGKMGEIMAKMAQLDRTGNVEKALSRDGDSSTLLAAFLETGRWLLPMSPQEIIGNMLRDQADQLKALLLGKWSLYPVRHRIIYQTAKEQLAKIFSLIFDSFSYFEWFMELLAQASPGQLIERNIRDLYFAFSELTARQPDKQWSKEAFLELLAVELMAVVDVSEKGKNDLLQSIGQDETISVQEVLRYVTKTKAPRGTSSSVSLLESFREIFSQGPTSDIYQKKLTDKAKLSQFILEVIHSGTLSARALIHEKIHPDFPSKMLVVLEADLVGKLVEQTTTIQSHAFKESISELTEWQKETDDKATLLYPIVTETYVTVFHELAKSKFSISARRLSDLLFEQVFEHFEKEAGNKDYEKVVNALLIRSGTPGFVERYPLLTSWLDRTSSQLVAAASSSGKHGLSQLILYYLEHKKLPKWSIVDRVDQIPEHLEREIAASGTEFLRNVFRTLDGRSIDSRFTALLTEKSFKMLLNLLQPGNFKGLLTVIDDLEKANQEGRLFKMPVEETKNWLRAIQIRQSLRQPAGDAMAVTKNLLLSMASEQAVSYLKMLLLINQSSLQSPVLREVLDKEIHRVKEEASNAWMTSAIASAYSDQYTTPDLIYHYLTRSGTRTEFPKWSRIKEIKTLKTIIQTGLKEYPYQLRSTFYRLDKQSKGIKELVGFLNTNDLTRLLKLLDESRFQTVEEVITDLSRLSSKKQEENLPYILLSSLVPSFMSLKSQYQTQEHLLSTVLETAASELQIPRADLYESLRASYGAIRSAPLKKFVGAHIPDSEVKSKREEWRSSGIHSEHQGQYSTADLIIYYLQTLSFPEWSGVNERHQLKKLMKEAASVAKPELVDILMAIKEDGLSVINFIALAGNSLVNTALKLVHPSKLSELNAIVEDLIRLKGKLPLVGQANLELLLQQQLVVAVVSSTTQIAPADFTTSLIREIAQKGSADIDDIYKDLKENAETIRSPLLKKVIDQAFLEPALQSTGNNLSSVEAHIDALLTMLSSKRVPWWYADQSDKKVMVSQEIPKLYKILQARHLPDLVSAIQKTENEKFYISELLKIISFTEFNQILAVIAPGVSPFVIMYTRALEMASKKKFSKASFAANAEFYSYLYRHIRDNHTGFSSSAFVTQVSRVLADSLKTPYPEMINQLLSAAEILLKKGERGYSVLIETLQAQSVSSKVAGDASPAYDAYSTGSLEDKREGPEDFLYLLSYYLTHGSIPFTAEIGSYKDFISTFDAYHASNPKGLRAVIRTSLSNAMPISRLLKQGYELPIRISALHYQLSRHEIESWIGTLTDFMKAVVPDTAKAKYQMTAMQVLLRSVSLAHFRNFNHVALIKMFMKALADKTPGFSQQLKDNLKMETFSADFSKDFLLTMEEALDLDTREPPRSLEIPEEATYDSIEGSLEIHNAGLVILANFLPRYFETLDMTTKGVFKTPEAAARAVHLLQYLATAKTETPEHELLLNKILCGVKFIEPVERFIELTEKEKEISESLLNGVLQNWERMKHISIDALREGFINRVGVLSEDPDSWTLDVGNSGKDVLLDSLPWSFSTIKLSWMKKSLHVKWRN